MTEEDIYKMVRESELGFLLGDNWMLHHEFEYFAKLIAEHEREACAKVCDEFNFGQAPMMIQKAIRARVQA